MTRLLHYLTWTHDLGDGDVPLPSGGDTALGQTQLSTVITRHLEIIIIVIIIIIIIIIITLLVLLVSSILFFLRQSSIFCIQNDCG